MIKLDQTSETDMSEPAFPVKFQDHSTTEYDGEMVVSLGMTLRDYFAAKAMAALLEVRAGEDWTDIAMKAYEIAEAMLAASGRNE